MTMDKEPTHKFERTVADFIAGHDFPRPHARLIVALSGGADSVALLAVLSALGYECVAVHCNFGLRGDESMRDCQHAREICRRLGIELHTKGFDVPARMTATGESLEMACRSLRYEWFAEMLDTHHAMAIAVGHHREDSAETFILNLMRSSGIAGLTGISPVNGRIVRPLLCATRPMIEQYLLDRGLSWVDDSTNATDDFRRNAVRHNVMPLLDRIFGNSTDAILQSAAYLTQAKAIYDRAISDARARYFKGTRIDVTALLADVRDSSIAATYLYEILRPLSFSRDTTDKMLHAAGGGRTGLVFNSRGSSTARLDRGILTLYDHSDIKADVTPQIHNIDITRDILSPVSIYATRCPIAQFDRSAIDSNSLYIDCRALEGDPVFSLRHWREGDRIRPFGMGGRSKLVSDIFSDAKYSHQRKQQTWLLTRNDTVIWIIGLRTSADWALKPDTREYIMLTPGQI